MRDDRCRQKSTFFLNPPPQSGKGVSQLTVPNAGDGARTQNHDVAAVQKSAILPKAFPDNSLEPVAVHRTADGFSGNRQTKPCIAETVVPKPGQTAPFRHLRALLKNPPVIHGGQQPSRTRKGRAISWQRLAIFRGLGEPDPWRGEPSKRSVHRGSPSGHETRGCVPASICWVERFFSYRYTKYIPSPRKSGAEKGR